ncbi:threonylcarbamoyl-AMP synthase [Flavobacterium sp. CBA20B-1]|uniref:L-threonylcarbamoyladenylate synthase n=1 Tax=unclassified Flavobacterium TaxID=196869 RepID=UPI002224BE2C|nr:MULTISPECIES: L-threonylcarbamoyladenylate synthase [unclassified Flavobacterium]WCM42780.1 threonylcarbamoyl-AMP synthase [Flavobacterium sp. CBA20B-1]
MEDINKEVHQAFEVIKNGGIILYPTDTVWGLGCDATNEEAVKKIYELKKRAESKSMIVLVNNDRLLYHVFKDIPQVAFDILDCAEKPTTLVLDEPRNVAKNLIAEDNSLGIRIVNTPFVFKLVERMKRPLVSTSANISGDVTPTRFSEISQEIINGVDYVVQLDQDKICKKSSTVIKLTNDAQVKILRK